MPGNCQYCGTRPKFVENGKEHPYCGRGCANKAKGNQSSTHATPQQGQLCEVCHVRPKFVENGKMHPYCGRGCASKAKVAAPAASHQGQLCEVCHARPKYVENGKTHPYCGRGCASKSKGSQANGPSITELAPGDNKYQSGGFDRFYQSWRHPDRGTPRISRIYKINPNPTLLRAYEQYCAAVEARGNFASQQGMTAGNEQRRWHGTARACNLGDNGQTQFCHTSSCKLCNIISNSFNLGFFLTSTKGARFGRGHYTSSTSSKANDYSRNPGYTKAILLNKVVVGKGKKVLRGEPALVAPPPGYDSILGETGGSLKYDELVVYRDDAICPAYLVIYQT